MEHSAIQVMKDKQVELKTSKIILHSQRLRFRKFSWCLKPIFTTILSNIFGEGRDR